MKAARDRSLERQKIQIAGEADSSSSQTADIHTESQAIFEEIKDDLGSKVAGESTPKALRVDGPSSFEVNTQITTNDISDIHREITWRWVIPDGCAAATVSLEPPHRFSTVNEAFQALTLFNRDELLRSSLRLLCGPDTNLQAMQALPRRVGQGHLSASLSTPLTLYRKDGEALACTIRAFAVAPPYGRTECVLAIQAATTAPDSSETDAPAARSAPPRPSPPLQNCSAPKCPKAADAAHPAD